jgi:SOS-response transcriptional repressor LexA
LQYDAHLGICQQEFSPKGDKMAIYTVGQRLEMLMKSMNRKQGEFAKEFGISNNSMIRYKTNERMPDPDFLCRLADSKVNLNWLLRGEGSMYVLAPWDVKVETKKAKSIDDTYLRTAMFPVSAEISAGEPIPVPENFEFAQHIEIPRSYLKEKPDQYMVFRVNGKSMEPVIQNNDIVVIQRCYDWSGVDGMVCAVRFEGAITLKRVQFVPKRQEVLLQPFNLDFQVQVLDSLQSEQLFLIGTIALQVRVY